MLSEQTMEKKSPGRSTSVTPKGNASEVKKDVPFKHARIFKPKDSQLTRPESSKKQTYSRWRNYSEKRPRPKTEGDFDRFKPGNDYNRVRPEYTQERYKAEDDFDGSQVAGVIASKEKGSFKNSKKMSFNHLLNFTVTSPNGASSFLTHDAPHLPYSRRSKLPKYNKEQFLLATCQFVVHDGGDYPLDIKNIDQLVEWDLIEEIRVPTSGMSDGGPVCPICLYPPVAAKITRCGHVYCWPCMLHYLALTDKPCRKCPICYEHIYKEDLKSVIFVPLTSYKVGDNVSMCLMKRDRNSIFAQPISSWKACLKKPLNVFDSKEASSFQKLLIATKNQIHSDIIHREQRELVHLLEEEGDKPEACFVEAALNFLRERETRLLQEEFAERQVAEVLKVVPGIQELSLFPEPDAENSTNIMASTSTSNICDEASPPTDFSEEESSDVRKNPKAFPSNTAKDHFYFYQVQDGQYMFLHALNVQMILAEYGAWENCPPMISGKIVEIENHSMVESLRSRLRYLGHLPLSTHFVVVELKLEPPLVSPATLALFQKDISARNKIRKGKARNERRKEIMELKKNNKDEVQFNLNSLHHFPPTLKSENSDSNEENIPASTTDFPSLQESPDNDMSNNTDTSSTSSPSSSSCQVQESTLSFAEMAKSGNARPYNWKLEENLYTAAAASAPTATLGDCIARALVDRQTTSNGNEGTSNGKGKRKKPKTTLLFSTGINYHK